MFEHEIYFLVIAYKYLDVANLFCMWMALFFSRICWRDYYYYILCLLHLCTLFENQLIVNF